MDQALDQLVVSWFVACLKWHQNGILTATPPNVQRIAALQTSLSTLTGITARTKNTITRTTYEKTSAEQFHRVPEHKVEMKPCNDGAKRLAAGQEEHEIDEEGESHA